MRAFCALGLACACATASSQLSLPAAGDVGAAERAFDRLSAMAGLWDAGGDGQNFPARFTVAARAKAVTQDSGFFAVFARDGGTILLTLFPDDGFQARMRAAANPATPDALEFAFVDATNLPAGAGRPTSMTMSFRSISEVVQTWRWRAYGVDSTFDVPLRRAPPSK